MRALVTGSTGHVGSHLTRALIERGIDVVCLARRAGRDSAARRVGAALSRAGLTGACGERGRGRVEVVEHELLDDPRRALAALCKPGTIDAVWHCAARTNLSPHVSADWCHENIVATKNVLALALGLDVERFLYVSTAYQCGHAPGRVPEERLERPRSFRNAYEFSKWAGEQILWEAFPGTLTVFRPSIVLGPVDAERVDSWQGYYAFVRKVQRLVQTRCNGSYRVDGAKLGIRGREETALDLVFVDAVTEAMAGIGLQSDSRGRTFHLTAPCRTTVGQMADDLAALIGRRPVVCEGVPSRAERSPILAAVNPYLEAGPVFDRSNTSEMLIRLGLREPRMTRARSRHHIALAIGHLEPARLVG